MGDKRDSVELIVLVIIGINMLFLMFFLLYFMFNVSKEITAGLIAFIGAIIGGFITYLGVKVTLDHRDKEVFLSSATEKLQGLEKLNANYNSYLNKAAAHEQAFFRENGISYMFVKEFFKEFYNQLIGDTELIYEVMSYDELRILEFHKKTFKVLIYKEALSNEDVKAGISKVRDVNKMFAVSKNNLDEKYYKLRSKKY